MPDLTIFSAPKPFTDPHIATIQRNAIQSWINLPKTEVLLIGDEIGLADTAAEFGVPLLSRVERNAWGTPLVSSIFELARHNSQSALLAYVNGDMLFTSDLIRAAATVAAQEDHFLIIGQRWDLDITEPIIFTDNWQTHLENLAKREGCLHPPQGSDYFIFPREQFGEMPPFAIGRAGWDNWMIYHACQQDWPVIDATPSILAIHQNHDYSHLPGGKPHYDLEESQLNTALAGGSTNLYNMLDTNAVLIDRKIRRPPPSMARLVRRIEQAFMPADHARHGVRWWAARRLRRLRRRLSHHT